VSGDPAIKVTVPYLCLETRQLESLSPIYDGGIAIYVAAEQPEGVPDENWLPLVRGDHAIDVIMRIYAPDLERFSDWAPPLAVSDNANYQACDSKNTCAS